MGSNKVIALWGSPGSGATVTSLKIAQTLAKAKNNVILVLCDDAVPMIPLILPSCAENKSLGDLLVQPDLTEISVLKHCIPTGKTLSLLGYQKCENELTYGEYSPARAKNLISLLRGMVDYVLIDCFHEMLVNVMTAAALELSDVVLRITNADPKSLICLESQKPYLAEERFHYDRHINIINNILPSQDPQPYEDALGGKAYFLPHVETLSRQYYEFCLLEPLTGRNSKEYKSTIEKMVKEVITNE